MHNQHVKLIFLSLSVPFCRNSENVWSVRPKGRPHYQGPLLWSSGRIRQELCPVHPMHGRLLGESWIWMRMIFFLKKKGGGKGELKCGRAVLFVSWKPKLGLKQTKKAKPRSSILLSSPPILPPPHGTHIYQTIKKNRKRILSHIFCHQKQRAELRRTFRGCIAPREIHSGVLRGEE